MLDQAIKKIEGCRSCDELQRLWAKNSGQWSRLTRDEASVVIRCKDRKKGEFESRIKRWIMDSKSIGRVELVYDEDKPDQAVVGGVEYRANELKTLFGRKLRRKDLLAVHEIKRVFEGRVLPEKWEKCLKRNEVSRHGC